jgi:glycosyltransferase involved in cell wall biosynthesis
MIDPARPDFSSTPVASNRPEFAYQPSDFMAPPAVSIITPFYDSGDVFEETAKSVLGQSLQQWEWLIINDGSRKLESHRILEACGRLDPRIRVVDLPGHLGLSAARNRGFREAQSRYVLQLDSDDLLEPTAAEKWAWFLETHVESAFTKGYSVGFGSQEYLWSRGFEESVTFLRENVVESTALVRRSVHEATGGYDESITYGLEDWDFWLNCAAKGYWGQTVPEHLSWYRRRPSHADRWPNLESGRRRNSFLAKLRSKYPTLWRKGFPTVQTPWHTPYAHVPSHMPFSNILRKTKQRLLMIVPWLNAGGADKFNLDLTEQLIHRDWEVTVAATAHGDNSWEHEFGRLTPDIFVLHRFLPMIDYPRFLRYLLGSRQPDIVMISNSELGYMLLPYLRSHCPRPAYVDFSHMEEEYWKNGGFPRKSLVYREQIDLSLVASEHLKKWMVTRGGDEGRIEVCYLNVDSDAWKPDPIQRAAVRCELGLSEAVQVLLFVGRLTQQKQPLVLLRVIEQLVDNGRELAAVVVGDGPENSRMEQFVHDHKLDKIVRMQGALPTLKVRQIMQAADVFFLPSDMEGIALTIYEAMSCAIPVVAAAVGGQNELVLSDCGLLVPHEGEDSDVANYVRVLGELLDDQKRMRLIGEAARVRVKQHFRIEQMGDRMVALFDGARRLRDEAPQPTVPTSLGDIVAQEAVESMRLFYLAEDLWHEREDWQRVPFRTRQYLRLRATFLPLYTRLGGNNKPWTLAAKQRLKRIMRA